MMESLTENQKNITDIYQELSYDELTNTLNEYLNGGSSEEEKEEESTPKSRTLLIILKKHRIHFDDLFNN